MGFSGPIGSWAMVQWFVGSIWVIGSWVTVSHGDSASISRFGWLGRVGWVMISRFGCFFFFFGFCYGWWLQVEKWERKVVGLWLLLLLVFFFF